MSVDPSKYSTLVNVRNFGEDMTSEKLKEIFSKYGTVTSCKIMLSDNVESGRFAYVAFEDPDAAEEAIIELHCQQLTQGRRIYLRRTGEKLIRQPKVKKNPECSNVERLNRCEIIVKHPFPLINEGDLRLLFDDYGIITSAKIIMENGRSKGYGFVSFETHEAANKAVTDMNGQRVLGERIHVALSSETDHNKYSRASGFATQSNERRGVRTNPTASTSREASLQLGLGEIEELLRVLNDGC